MQFLLKQKKPEFDRLMDNIINFEQDSTVCVISRGSLAQRVRRKREKFSKRARDEKDSNIRVISKASLAQCVRREREGFAKRARLEQDIIAQDSSIRVISKGSFVQRVRRKREGFVKRVRLEQDTITQEDDSDLEYDLDASPPVSAEASAEAAACVKVLISSGLPSVVNMANGSAVEASMTINVPNAQSSKASCGNILPSSSIQGTNITVPVSIQKQSSAGIASEAGETTGDNSQAHRKRRKKVWAEEEDIKLVAAVKQCGEGNWAGMAKEHFKGDRTPGQLYQRWTTMKRKNNSEAGGTNPHSSQKYEQAMATHRAIDMALKDSSFTSAGNSNRAVGSAVGNGAATSSNPTTVNASGVVHSSAKKDPTSQKQPHHQVPIPSASKAAVSGPPPMPRPPLTVKSPVNPTLTPDSMVKAAPRAAGARIASKSEATIFKETQSKKVVHFPLVKPSGTGAGSLLRTVSVPGQPSQASHISGAPSVCHCCGSYPVSRGCWKSSSGGQRTQTCRPTCCTSVCQACSCSCSICCNNRCFATPTPCSICGNNHCFAVPTPSAA